MREAPFFHRMTEKSRGFVSNKKAGSREGRKARQAKKGKSKSLSLRSLRPLREILMRLPWPVKLP
jgi:hypothetical protein